MENDNNKKIKELEKEIEILKNNGKYFKQEIDELKSAINFIQGALDKHGIHL